MGTSGVGGGGDAAARMQAVYNQKERDLDAKHREEIVDLKADFQVEKDKLRTDAKKRIENIQTESNQKLSDKDMQHQKEIDNIKAIYSKRIAEVKRESEPDAEA